ncbi:hypothetical protein ACEWY4_005916 [Coilia grayii]|uniref:Putative nuclease HARBI1 n=1 Tax=Coilia grayii TaxID=363190 RepID=A0ABD1KKB6_9TELE
MADLALLEDLNARIRQERMFRDRRDFFRENDVWLISRFCLPRHLLMELCDTLEPQLQRETRRSNAIPVSIQVLSTLAFLATGSFQREIGDRSGVSQPSLSRIMPSVLRAINSLAGRYIQFPYDDAQQTVIKMAFYGIAEFPNVVGAIDCTHVRLKPPSVGDYAYINRKNFHSLNVQPSHSCVGKYGVCCSLYLVSFYHLFKQLTRLCNSPGDKGYPLTEYLVTPLAHPQTEQERRFNRSHIRTRAIVERCIGLLKGRWLCLGAAGGSLLYTPEKVCNIIIACGVLHNIAQKNGVPCDHVHQENPIPRDPWPVPAQATAVRRREELIRRF